MPRRREGRGGKREGWQGCIVFVAVAGFETKLLTCHAQPVTRNLPSLLRVCLRALRAFASRLHADTAGRVAPLSFAAMKGWAVFLFILGLLGIGFGVTQDDWLLWSGVVCFAIATGLIVGLVTFPRKTMTVIPVSDREFRVLPLRTRAEQFWTFATPFGVGLIASVVIVCRRYFKTHTLSQESISLIVAGVISGIALAVHATRCFLSGRKVALPRVFLTANPSDVKTLKLDGPFHVRVEVDAYVPVTFDQCQISLRCMQHLLLHYGRYVHHDIRKMSEQLVKRIERIDLSPNHPLIFSEDVVLPSEEHVPTGKSGITMYPFYHWEIEVKLSGPSNSVTVYPVEVEGQSPTAAIG